MKHSDPIGPRAVHSPADDATRVRSLIDELWLRFPGLADHELTRWDTQRRELVARLARCEVVAQMPAYKITARSRRTGEVRTFTGEGPSGDHVYRAAYQSDPEWFGSSEFSRRELVTVHIEASLFSFPATMPGQLGMDTDHA